MALQTADQMGYASPMTIRSVIGRYRDQNLPQPVTVDSIQRIGVTESLAPRTIQTLKLLGLIDDGGNITEQFQRLKRVPTSEFKAELISMLRSAYAPVFELIEPAGATYEHVQDAFRTFKPEGQRDRMVSLFLGLLEYAEYSSDLPSGRASGSGRSAAAGRSSGPRTPKDKPSERENNTRREPLPPAPAPPGEGDTYTVELASGGDIFVRVRVDVFGLSLEDRNYVMDIVDKLKGYPNPPAESNSSTASNKNGPSEEGPSGQPSGDGGGVTSR